MQHVENNKNPSTKTLTKYPYKPALVLALIKEEKENLFNKKIDIKDTNNEVAKNYYDILMGSETTYNTLKNYKYFNGKWNYL